MNNFNEKYGERQIINRSQWADTYRAVNSITQDIVTLKVIINNSNNKEYIDDLRKEVRILKDMENPNLICINTVGSIVGEENTYPYIECENFSGISLKEKLQSGKLSGVEAIKILKQVAEGLKEFHFKSIVYGKLSCDNIYVDENGAVKIDILAYLEGKVSNEPLEEEFSGEEDIYSLGVVLFELITGNTNFKPGKCKHKISDEDLLYIIDKCTNKKFSIYEDLNKFIEDANAYLEYCGEGTTVDIQEEVLIEEYDEEHEVEIKKNHYKTTLLKLMISLGACLLVFLMLSTIIKGGSLFNNKEKTASAKPPVQPVVTQPEEEILEDEEAVEKETPEVEPASNDNDNYSEPVYNNTDNNSNNNDTSNDYYPNNGNSNNNNNNNSNNNNNGNNSGNNGNNSGGQYPGEDDTDNPGGDTNNPGDGSGEETPTPEPLPDPNPEPTPDPTPDSGGSDAGIESETE